MSWYYEIMNEKLNKNENLGRKIKTAVVGAFALASTNIAIAQQNAPTVEKQKPPVGQDSSFKKEISESDLQEIYNRNKDKNDLAFNEVFFVSGLPDTQQVVVKYKGIKNIDIKVRTNEGSDSTRQEEFTNLDDLEKKYPEVYKKVKDQFADMYSAYTSEVAWTQIADDTEKTLSNDMHNYVASAEEIKILKDAAELKNNGGNSDGYDALIAFYNIKTSKDRYNFDIQHGATVNVVIKYLRNEYFLPLLKNKQN